MAETRTDQRRFFVIGANHRSSGLGLRDRLFIEDGDVPDVLAKLKDQGVAEGIVLSTCDRVEILAADIHPEQSAVTISRFFAERAGVDEKELAEQLYFYSGAEAVRHTFAVAASLDSLVIGEPQVLGQVKAAHRMAEKAEMTGPVVEQVIQAAYGAAKRVRSETAITEQPVSIAAAAVDLARGLHGDLNRVSALMIGAGEMGELIAKQFTGGGLGNLEVTHPIRARVEPMAREFDCHIREFDDLAEAMVTSDIVICAMGRRDYALTADMVRAALKKRRNRPQFIIDTGVPGDVEPAVNRIDEAFLYDIGDLERLAVEGLSSREKEASAARKIVDECLDKYTRGVAERDAVPALSALRDHFETVRRQVLEEKESDPERVSSLLVKRLLHTPTIALKEIAASGSEDPGQAERLLRRLFDLDRDDRETGEDREIEP